jgi:hypothetical protein
VRLVTPAKPSIPRRLDRGSGTKLDEGLNHHGDSS